MRRQPTYNKVCIMCKKEFTAARIHADCCSKACRTKKSNIKLSQDIILEKARPEIKKEIIKELEELSYNKYFKSLSELNYIKGQINQFHPDEYNNTEADIQSCKEMREERAEEYKELVDAYYKKAEEVHKDLNVYLKTKG